MMRNISSVDFLNFDCTLSNTFQCNSVYFAWRVIPFILITIGIFGNILNFIVLSRPRIRSFSTTTYLLFLAGSDIVFQVTVVLNDTLYSITGKQIADFSEAYCKVHKWLRFTCGAFSIWLLVLMTIERMIVVKAPLFARSKLSPKSSKIIALVTLTLISLCNAHLIPGSSYILVGNDSSHGKCTYSRFIRGIWNIIVLTFYTVIPAILIFIGNANIAFVLLLNRRNVSRVQPTTGTNNIRAQDGVRIQTISTVNRDRHNDVTMEEPHVDNVTINPINSRNIRRNSKKRSSTRLLFTISVFFLLTTVPYCIYAIVIGQLQELDDDGIASWRALTFFIHILAWSNFSFNFFLYFVSGTLFKQEWKILIENVKRRLY